MNTPFEGARNVKVSDRRLHKFSRNIVSMAGSQNAVIDTGHYLLYVDDKVAGSKLLDERVCSGLRASGVERMMFSSVDVATMTDVVRSLFSKDAPGLFKAFGLNSAKISGLTPDWVLSHLENITLRSQDLDLIGSVVRFLPDPMDPKTDVWPIRSEDMNLISAEAADIIRYGLWFPESAKNMDLAMASQSLIAWSSSARILSQDERYKDEPYIYDMPVKQGRFAVAKMTENGLKLSSLNDGMLKKIVHQRLTEYKVYLSCAYSDRSSYLLSQNMFSEALNDIRLASEISPHVFQFKHDREILESTLGMINGRPTFIMPDLGSRPISLN